MKAMILCAGRGERLRPLTDAIPKPLLEAGGRSLLSYLVDSLAAAGLKQTVINVSWLSDNFRRFADAAVQRGLEISISDEGESALETGGGIHNALPLLGSKSFVVVNGDIWTDYPFGNLNLPEGSKAHLVMAPNPTHNPDGDFSLIDGLVTDRNSTRYTFSGIGVYSPALFEGCIPGCFPLVPLLKDTMQENAVTGELYEGAWFDIGTKERLEQLDDFLRLRNED